MKTTGKIIAELRKEKGMSQEELADVLFVTRQAISKWESDAGSPGIDNLERIADYFNVTIDYLLGKKGRWRISLRNPGKGEAREQKGGEENGGYQEKARPSFGNPGSRRDHLARRGILRSLLLIWKDERQFA